MATQQSASVTVTLSGERGISVTRVFRAPRRLVYDAHTKPELVKRWLGVRGGWTLPVCEIDLRVGGKYRYVWHNEARGKSMGMGGEFREIVTNERIVCTEKFDQAWYPGEAMNTSSFDEQNGNTTLSLLVEYETQEARDAAMGSGFSGGLGESYDALAELLTTLA